MNTLLTWLVEFFSSKWTPVAAFMAALMIVYTNVLGIMDVAKDLVSQMSGASNPGVGSVTSLAVSGYSLVNYVIPLDLCLALFLLWMPFFLTAASIRLVKSFVPTVAS